MINSPLAEIDFGNVSLENNRVQLLPLQQSHLSTLLPFSLKEPELWRYSMVSAGGGEHAMQAYLDAAIHGREQRKEIPFLVIDKQTMQVAGSTRFYDIQLQNLSTQLGFTWYGKDFQGTGLNRHCKFLMLEFAFETCKFVRVEFRADALNQRSIAAMKRIGCVEEGVLRKNGFRNNGSMRDSIILSILADEWTAHVKQDLQELIA